MRKSIGKRILAVAMTLVTAASMTACGGGDKKTSSGVDGDNMTAMIFGEVYRNNGEWKFNAIGQATTDPGLVELARRYM